MNLPPPLSMRSTEITDQQLRQRTHAYDEHSPWSELSGLCLEDAMQPEAAGASVTGEGGTARDFVKDGQALADAARLHAMAWSDTVSDRCVSSNPLTVSGGSCGVSESCPASETAADGGVAVASGGGGDTEWKGVTQVTVSELDWRDDVGFLDPPFDVVLVADVVRPVTLPSTQELGSRQEDKQVMTDLNRLGTITTCAPADRTQLLGSVNRNCSSREKLLYVRDMTPADHLEPYLDHVPQPYFEQRAWD